MNKSLSTVLCATGFVLLVSATAHKFLPLVPSALNSVQLDSVLLNSVLQDPMLQDPVLDNTAAAQDRLTHPNEVQSFTAGSYQLTITAVDGWQTPATIGELRQEGTSLWRRSLPHQYGPKFVLLTSAGQTILFDEYINVASDYAIALIDRSGKTAFTYSFDDIHKAIQTASPDIERADVARQATAGWWISAPPTLDQASAYALVKTGGTTLMIDLSTGELSPLPS